MLLHFFASHWKIWFNFWKCVLAKITSFFLLSFRWLLNLRSKVVSILPTYCISKFYFEISKLWLGFYMLTGGKFCMFFLFYNFWRRLFFPLVENKHYHILCNMGYFSAFFFLITLLFEILLLSIISLRFLYLLYAIIGFSWNAFLA